jgi:site-specific DNA recombinase
MRVACYVRVSTDRQQRAQTINQQLSQLKAYIASQTGWEIREEHIFRDDGYSGARLDRPGLDALRDQAAQAAFDLVLITAPDRLARKYVHQMIVLEELERRGIRVVFIDRPPSDDPHEQLVVQIRGAVAEYERTLIADRMRRGRQAKLRSGQLLPWTRPPYGYRLHPEQPRNPALVAIDPAAAAIVQEVYAAYADEGLTLHALAVRLTAGRVPSPTGKAIWSASTLHGILTNPAYMGQATSGRFRTIPARGRRSALGALGRGMAVQARPSEEWIRIAVPALVTAEQFAAVQRRLATNQQFARRSTTHPYLLRGLVSCGMCRLSCTGRGGHWAGDRYRYYQCRGKLTAVATGRAERCTARFIPAAQLDAVVWADLCAILQHPEVLTAELARARGGAWVPGELRRRRETLRGAQASVTRQRERLLEAYLAEALDLASFERKDQALRQQQEDLQAREREVVAQGERVVEVSAAAQSMTAVCERLRTGLEQASFAQRQQLVELLIDRVVVTDGAVEIRYVIPTTEASTHTRFCHLRKDYFEVKSADVRTPDASEVGGGRVGTVPPPPQHGWFAGPPRQPADLDQDEGAWHHRFGGAQRARSVLTGPGMQPCPGTDADLTILAVALGMLRRRHWPGVWSPSWRTSARVALGMLRRRHWPGGRIGARKLTAMAAGAADARIGCRVRGEAPAAAQPHEEGSAGLPQFLGEVERVVAGVEDEQRYRGVGRQVGDEVGDLLNSHGVGGGAGMDAAHIERSGPTVAGQAQLRQPLISPTCDNGLAGGVARGVVGEAAVGAGLGIAARPDADIDGVDRVVACARLAHQQGAEAGHVDLAVSQRCIEAAPAAAVHAFQAQVDW